VYSSFCRGHLANCHVEGSNDKNPRLSAVGRETCERRMAFGIVRDDGTGESEL